MSGEPRADGPREDAADAAPCAVPDPTAEPAGDELRRRLLEVEERIDRIRKRFVAGYGSDDDRAGWLRWLDELELRRGEHRERIAGSPGPGGRGRRDDPDRAPAQRAQGRPGSRRRGSARHVR